MEIILKIHPQIYFIPWLICSLLYYTGMIMLLIVCFLYSNVTPEFLASFRGQYSILELHHARCSSVSTKHIRLRKRNSENTVLLFNTGILYQWFSDSMFLHIFQDNQLVPHTFFHCISFEKCFSSSVPGDDVSQKLSGAVVLFYRTKGYPLTPHTAANYRAAQSQTCHY